MPIGAAIGIVWDVLKMGFAPIKRGFGYVMSSKSYTDNLRQEVGKLDEQVVSVRRLAESARNNCRLLYPRFTRWDDNAERNSREAHRLLDAFDKATKTCCYGRLPDPKCRYQFSKDAKDKIEVIQKLAREGGEFKELNDISSTGSAPGQVTVSNPARRVQSPTATAPASSASMSVELRDHGIFESRASMIRKIIDALADNSNSVVGVHGMGGVGKSTLLDQVKDILLIEEKSFHWVAKADVSKNPDVKMIQEEIAHWLGLTEIKKEESVEMRAKLLLKRLEYEKSEKKKVLIILDNLWERLDLKSVGIPCGHDNKVEGCKLLLTSRNQRLLQREMGSDEEFLLGELEEEEARALFERTVGDKVHDGEFKPWVEKALHRCAGVPFLIVAMAKRFKKAQLFEWRDALRKMAKFKDKDINESIDYMLRWSYDNLEEDEQSLLRLCAVYSVSKPSLENLLRYGFGLGLFQQVNSMEEAVDRLHTQIRALQASSLLLDSEDVGGFKIHDLVREFVASVSSTDHPLLVLEDQVKSVIESQEDKLKSCEAMCFPDMKELPQELCCPELRIFLLFSNNKSAEVPDSYFNSMRKLAVLNLTSIRLTRSLTPFQLSENLHTLCLQSCLLEDVTILGKLKGLQILSLRNSDIQRLPKEIGQLADLKLLELSHCSRLEIIEPSVLGSLIKLEELYMENSFRQWSVGEQTPPTNASLIELNNMKNLRTLHVSIPNPSALPKELNFKQLTKYRIQIGDVWRWSKYNGSRMLELKLNPASDCLHKECIQSILSKTEELYLDGLNETEQSIYRLSPEGFPQLKHLEVKRGPSIRYILEWSSLPTFKALETLLLENMINLEKICHNHISTESFSSLRVVRVQSCDKMEVLFPRSVVRELRQLEEIEVQTCKLMRGIVEADDDRGKFELPNLRVLKLHGLPNIENFIIARSSPSSYTSNDQVGAQIAFFNGQQVAFPKLETLRIDGSDNLRFTFSQSMVKSLAQLRKLSIRNCKKMEAIIMAEEGSRVELSETLAFPMLIDLRLKWLESLTCFSREKCSRAGGSQDRVQLHPSALFNREVAFPKLESLDMTGCHNVGFMFCPSMVKSLAKLRTLTIRYCKKMEAIIIEEEGLRMETSETLAFPMLTDLTLGYLESLTCFSHGSQETQSQDHVKSRSTVLFSHEVAFLKLEILDITGCHNLKFTFSQSMVKSLKQLRELSVSDCKKMEAIIMEEEGSRVEISETLAFPMLTDLRLQRLESLTCFSRGKCSQEGQSQDHVQLHSSSLFNGKVSFPFLESLTIKGLPNLKDIWNDESPLELSNLQSLKVVQCSSLSKVISYRSLVKLRKMQTLYIEGCVSVQEIFDPEGPSANGDDETLLVLTNLELRGLRSLRRIWNKSSSGIVSFQNLKVDDCDNLQFIFFPSMVKSLSQLRDLTISNCKKMEAIFSEEEGLGLEISEILTFPMLTNLTLTYLESLTSFSRTKCSQEARSQDCVNSYSAALFSREVTFPSLEKLYIEGMDNIEMIWDDQIVVDSFSKLNSLNVCRCNKLVNVVHSIILGQLLSLKTLDVSYCDGLSNMFTPTMATNLVGLTKLRISKCGLLTEVISDEGGREGHVVAFNQLKCIELDGLIGLRYFYSGGYTLKMPLLEEVIVTECLKMKFFSEGQIEASKLQKVKVSERAWFWKENLNITIQHMFEEMGTAAGVNNMLLFEFPELIEKWHSELNPIKSSWQLESLTVNKCPLFINAIPSKLMLVLENLETLQVRDCESLEEIFDLEGLETVESTRALPSFETLDLVNLPKLRRLWNKDLQGSLSNNFLTSVTLYKCSNLTHAFVPSMARCLANLERMEIKECGQMEGVIAEEEGQGSAMEKILFPELGQLKLECLPNLTSFLLGKYHTLECPKLEDLTIAHCTQMRNLAWQSLMEIDNATRSLFTPQVQFPRLRQMVLSHMDNLCKIWTDDPQETLTFDYLKEVEVQNCESLENLFPYWVATSLTQLEKLRVESCRIEEIVANGDDAPHSTTAQVLFPKLRSLALHDMPRLKTFCPNLPTLNWPFLEELRVTHCDKVTMLSFAAFMNKWTPRDDQQDISHQEEHSTFERDFPNLERLCLVDKDLQMIQEEKFPSDVFGELKALTLTCFHDERAIFPSKFLLERFQNLESLEIFCGSFEDIFPDEGLVDEGKHPMLESLRELKLSKLDKLKLVWREDYLVSKILQSIETLEIWDCPGLTTLFPATTSFRNLTMLVVKNSSGLVHLGTVSAIANSVHLQDMTIIGCERMKEVVAKDENGEGKVISFENLGSLTLQDMPSLECFSSTTSCILRFPSLSWIEVEECPKMKIFSKGTLSTPMLSGGTLFRYSNWYDYWESDLNRAIRDLSA